MYQLANAMIQRITRHFNAGNLVAMAEAYVFPLPVHMNGNMIVLRTPSELVQALALYRDLNLAEALFPSAPRIVAIDVPRNGRFRLWVDISYGSPAAPDQRTTSSIHYCSFIGNRVQIEMVQYLNLAVSVEMIGVLQEQQKRTA